MKKTYFTALLGLTHFFLLAQTEFITTWRTNNPGISGNNQITIPTFPDESYDYTIDWGDGTSDTGVTGDITHTYTTPGTYTVTIGGIFPRIYFNYETGNPIRADEKKLLTIEQWGNIVWSSMSEAFYGCINMDVLAIDVPNLSNVSSTEGMFRECSALVGNPSFNEWNVSNIINMTAMFFNANEFDSPLNDWNVSNVETFNSMFNGATKFNQPLKNWNLISATFIGGMFSRTQAFNQDIGDWNVSSVVNMEYLFSGAESFNQDLSNWNVSNVTSMRSMFQRASAYNQDMSSWDVRKVQRMDAMFRWAIVFNQDIGNWDMESVVLTNSMFRGANSFNQDISNWNVGNVTDMAEMFMDAVSFDQPIGNWDVGSITDMSSMFDGASSFNQNLSDWNVSLVNDMTLMFRGTKLSTPNYDALLRGWSSLPGLRNNVIFDAGPSRFCQAAEARQDLIDTFGWTISDNGKRCSFITTWNTVNPGTSANNQITIPTNLSETYFYEVDWGDGTSNMGVTGDITHTYTVPGTYQVSIFGQFPTIFFRDQGDTKKLIFIDQWGEIIWGDMIQAFKGCSNMDVLATDLPNFSNTSTISGMFANCSSLIGNESFNNWDVSQITWMTEVFNGAFSFNQDIGNWDVGNVQNMAAMFMRSTSFNQDIGNWNVSNVTSMQAMFQGAESFNQDIGNWNVSNVEVMLQMFTGARAFNQDIGKWDVSTVTRMYSMFLGASSFNQDIGGWDVSNAINISNMFHFATAFDQDLGNWQINRNAEMDHMFSNAGLSIENYDSLLNGWHTQVLKSGVTFDAGSSQYCEATDARQFIIDTHGWTIVDAGEAPLCNQDNDLDGVMDHKDSCLETLPGIQVNANGCDFIPNDAINVYVSTLSCVGSSNGAIEITMGTSGYMIDILIEGEGISNQFDDISSGPGFKIGNLPVGAYTVTVSIPEVLFEQKYGVIVNELNSVSGKRASLDSKSGTISYSVMGSKNYVVLVNGQKKSFAFNHTGQQTISLENLRGQNEVIISGTSDCQGKITDSFFINDSVQVFPTISSTSVNFLTNGSDLTIKVFGLDGRLVKEQSYYQSENKMDISSLKTGLYFLQMETNGLKKTVKIVKK